MHSVEETLLKMGFVWGVTHGSPQRDYWDSFGPGGGREELGLRKIAPSKRAVSTQADALGQS